MDGHTVLRYVSDIYTETILRFAKTINSQTKSIFHSYKPNGKDALDDPNNIIDSNPRRIEWNMTDTVRLGIRFAETRLSDLILQNEVKVLEFNKYGKYFITDMKMSPDAFVQVIKSHWSFYLSNSHIFFLHVDGFSSSLLWSLW